MSFPSIASVKGETGVGRTADLIKRAHLAVKIKPERLNQKGPKDLLTCLTNCLLACLFIHLLAYPLAYLSTCLFIHLLAYPLACLLAYPLDQLDFGVSIRTA